MRLNKENLLLILNFTLILFFSTNGHGQPETCEGYFKLTETVAEGELATTSGSLALIQNSPPHFVDSESQEIIASQRGFENREELIDWVTQMMSSKLDSLNTEAQDAFLKLFGANGLFLNRDSIWFMLAPLSQNTITEIRELNQKGDKIEPDLLFSIIEEIYKELDSLLNSPDAGLLRNFLSQHYIKSISPKKLWRNFKRFKEALSQPENASETNRDPDETIKTLIGLGIFHNILELNLLDKKGLPIPAQKYLYEKRDTNFGSYSESNSVIWNHDGVTPFFSTTFLGVGAGLVDLLVFPGLGSGSFAALQVYFRNSGYSYWIKHPIQRRLAEKRLTQRASLLEAHLNEGSLSLSPGSRGETNQNFDPARISMPVEYKFDENRFLENYEQVKDDPDEVERLVRINLNKFSLAYQETLFQAMLEDQDYFNAWDKLKKINDQGNPDFDDIKEIHRIFTQASSYYWSLRNLLKSIQEKLEAFKATVVEGVSFADKELVVRLIDDKISKIEEQKIKFTKDSKHLIDLATNALELNLERIRELIDERPHLRNQVQIRETAPLLDGPTIKRVGVVKRTKAVSYQTYTQDKSKLPAGKRGTVEVYMDPKVEGYPVILGISGKADLALCKKLVKLTGIDGSHSGVIGKNHHTSFTGDVARVIGYNRFTKTLKVSIERVEDSSEVVKTLDCY